MKSSQHRKRKTDDVELFSGSSKEGKTAKSVSDNSEPLTSKYFKTNSSKKLDQSGRDIKGAQKTNKPRESHPELIAAVADDHKRNVKKRTNTVDIAGNEDISGVKSEDNSGCSNSAAETEETVISKERLDFRFYDLPCEDLAKALLGQVIVSVHEGKRLAGKIVETEAYLGHVDKAAHSFKGKTDRNAAMFMKPGTAYVYNIYGMYCCLNISGQGDGCAVLIRALQPMENLEVMEKLRKKGKSSGNSLLKKNGKELCNGPSKLCQALAIKKDSVNKVDLCLSDRIWVEKGEIVENNKVVVCKRININYAEEWIDKPLRFYIYGNEFNSVKDKNAEKDFMNKK